MAETLIPHLQELFTTEAREQKLSDEYLARLFVNLGRDFAGNFYYHAATLFAEQNKAEERRKYEIQEKERIASLKPIELSFEDFKSTIEAKWRDIVAQEDAKTDFAIDSYCSAEFTQILNFFYGKANESNLDLRKGFLVMGPVGCRKTSMMQAFQNNPFASFRIIEAQDMVQAYKEVGDMAFNYFHITDKRNKFGHESYEICIDEVGREERNVIAKGASFSSTHINFIEEYIFRLYKNPRRLHIITNATSYQDLVKTYSEAAASRLLKLFNVVIFPENSPNYRLVNL